MRVEEVELPLVSFEVVVFQIANEDCLAATLSEEVNGGSTNSKRRVSACMLEVSVYVPRCIKVIR